MIITQNITLDLLVRGDQTMISAKQGDDGSRFVCVELISGGVAYVPPAGATAYFRCLKPDGRSCYNPATINAGGTITVELTEQVLAVAGRVAADVSLVGSAGEVLSSVSFMIYVEPAPVGNLAESHDELGAYEKRLEKIQQALQEQETTTGICAVAGITVTESEEQLTMTTALSNGGKLVDVMMLDADGEPIQVNLSGGQTIPITWEVAT